MINRFSILGSGSWGTALANLLANNGEECLIFTKNNEVFDSISKDKVNKTYHPDFKLNKNIKITKNLSEFSIFSDLWIIAIPSKEISSVLKLINAEILKKKEFIIASKGIDKNSLYTISDVLIKEFNIDSSKIFIISGPNLAKEVMEQQVSASVLAGDDLSKAEKISKSFNNNFFKVFLSNDKKGVELSGSLKNIYAISAGIADGLGNKFNTKAMILTRSLHEMSELLKSLGASSETLMGLAGVGDLIATSSSSNSRNYSFGYYLGQGMDVETSLKKVNQVVEGIGTLEIIFKKKKELNLTMPIVDILNKIIFEKESPKDCFADILIEGDNRDT